MTEPLFFSTRAHVLVCTGPRCAQRGARALFRDAWQEGEATGRAYYVEGGTVRLTESGCQGACDHGPNAIAYYGAPSGAGLAEAWFHGLDRARLLELVTALHEGRALPPKGRYDRCGDR